MLREVSDHSYAQSRDCQENDRSCRQKGVRLHPSNDGPALSWHLWTRLVSVTMTTRYKLPKGHWDQKPANTNQLFPFCSKDISEHNPFKRSSTTHINTMCEKSLGIHSYFHGCLCLLGLQCPPIPQAPPNTQPRLQIKKSVRRCHVRTLLFTYLLL